MSDDIILDAGDVTVKPIEPELCECEEAPVDSVVWVDLRSAGMSVAIGSYCSSCAEEIAIRVRRGLPVIPPAPEAK